MSAREAAKRLLDRAHAEQVRLPTIWDESTAMQNCGAALMVHRKDGGFDEEAALDDLISKYGQIASATSGSKRKLEDGENEEAEAKAEELDKDGAAVISEEEGEGSENEGRKTKKRKAPAVKKTEIVAVEENRAIAEAIQEMATIAFKNKDARKGGVFAKAAKTLREHDEVIASGKAAMALKGIGKGIAGYIDEQLQTGSIKKLEEMRAGIA